MIIKSGDIFLLQTRNTSYLFRKTATGHLENLHYGRSLISDKDYAENLRLLGANNDSIISGSMSAKLGDLEKALKAKKFFQGGNMISYDDSNPGVFLEDMCLEMSSKGKGDIREPFIEITLSDGTISSDFVFENAEVSEGKAGLISMPSSYDEQGKDISFFEKEILVESDGDSKADDKRGMCAKEVIGKDFVSYLTITLKDNNSDTQLLLVYSVYPGCDVITRSTKLISGASNDEIKINKIMSMQLDLHDTGFSFTSFHGRWADEMHRVDNVCRGGRIVSDELSAGVSGSRSNPFTFINRHDTTEDSGECYGFNLIYSGNHYEALSSNGYDKSRFVCGIQPSGFSWKLLGGESFETPEAVMTFSGEGIGGMSRNMHSFIREHIVRGYWKKRERPVLINSWEASYFNFSQSGLLSLAKAAKSVGTELFVLDDGWFGKRNNDKTSLGDWIVNKDKLPDGLKGLCDKINALGMNFGIWVEPEMINEDSDLYRAHPEFAVKIPGKAHSEGRNQLQLDLTRGDVQDYVIASMSNVFSSCNISYVKWDMNRIFSDVYSDVLGADRMHEFPHRYVLGLYRCMKILTEKFPKILFEGCASGGNRFDLGILSYFPQIWASDDTDCFARARIQRGYSYGYPTSVIGAHVSASPNHQTMQVSPLSTRFNTACFGCLGYELNLMDLSKSELSEVAVDISFYKDNRNLFQFGEYYRLDKNRAMLVSSDRSAAVVYILQSEDGPQFAENSLRTKGLSCEKKYEVSNRYVNISLKEFGSLVNTMELPVHIKDGGLIQSVASTFVTMHNVTESYVLSGAALNGCGVRLDPSFCGLGFGNDGNIGIFRRGDSRLYMIKAVK